MSFYMAHSAPPLPRPIAIQQIAGEKKEGTHNPVKNTSLCATILSNSYRCAGHISHTVHDTGLGSENTYVHTPP